ncbi:hypothetical protein HQ590_01445, partial [bacterium]|nr:hypothetical protein [bacterium]
MNTTPLPPDGPDRTAPLVSPSIEADAEQLLESSDFLGEQFGMAVESVASAADGFTVRTTGAEFVFEPAAGVVRVHQRLGRERPAARLTLPAGCLENLRVEGKGSGAVRLSARGGKLQLRVNGDSLLMIRDAEPLFFSGRTGFSPAIVRQYAGNILLLDESGG